MAIPRPTFQQRLFSDDELPLQSHDRIVRWVDTNLRSNPGPFLRELDIKHEVTELGCLCGRETLFFEHDVDGTDELSALLVKMAKKHLPPLPVSPKMEVFGIGWEPIIKDERSTIIGAVDLTAILRERALGVEIPIYNLGYEKHAVEKSILALLPPDGRIGFFDGRKLWVDGKAIQDGLSIDGFPTDVVGCAFSRNRVRFLAKPYVSKHLQHYDTRLYIEVKTKIRSAGELLRQVNLYRYTVARGSRFVVVAPADAWEPDVKNILREQGVGAMDYLSN